MADRLNLSGDWTGIFNYPEPHPPNGFEALLRDHDGAITGETRERSDSVEDVDPEQIAILTGQRAGRSVTFVKSYDDLRRAQNPVHYDGTVSEDGDEITGRWIIHGEWSGTFLMVRAGGRTEEIEREAEEELRL